MMKVEKINTGEFTEGQVQLFDRFRTFQFDLMDFEGVHVELDGIQEYNATWQCGKVFKVRLENRNPPGKGGCVSTATEPRFGGINMCDIFHPSCRNNGNNWFCNGRAIVFMDEPAIILGRWSVLEQ